MLSKVFIFVAGAAIGSVATWRFVKTKYEQIAEEEIESMREYYDGKLQNLASKNIENSESDTAKTAVKGFESNSQEAATVLETYKNYASMYQSIVEDETGKSTMEFDGNVKMNIEKKEEEGMENKPYVISPEEFGEVGYNQVSLTYYADGTLADEHDDVIGDVDSLIGKESLDHFGEYEDDSVFVRNVQLETDFEILKDLRNYYEE